MENMLIKEEINHEKLKPMSFGLSVLFFGIPTVLFVFSFYGIMPLLIGLGYTPFYSYFFSMGGSLLLMLIASLIAYKLEGNTWTWKCFRDRYRLYSLKKKDWVLLIIVFLGSSVSFILLSPVLDKIVRSGFMLIPSSLPEWLNPLTTKPPETLLEQAFGGLKGNWLAVYAFILLLIINIIGEEFWWRGYILPRQELVFGKTTWLVHGLLWAFFHAFKWWDIIGLLLITLPLSYLVCRLKNNTPGIILHFIVNGINLIPIIIAAAK